MKQVILITMMILLIGSVLAIQVPSEITIFSGDTYSGEVIAKNYASTGGSFTLTGECGDSVSITGSEQFFQAGEEKGISFQLSGSNLTKEDIVVECTYTVTDRKSQSAASEKGLVIVKGYCDSNEDCQTGEECNLMTQQCIEKTNENLPEKDNFNWSLFGIIGLAILLIVFITFYFFKKK